MKQDTNAPRELAVFASNDEERLFLRRLQDAAKSVRQTGKVWYSAFLDSRQQALACGALRKQGLQFTLYGGYQGAERAMLCVFEDEGEVSFPLRALTLRPIGREAPAHRDYLGAILALGVERGGVGDICVGEEGAVAWLKDTVEALVLAELSSVGRVNVTVEEGQGLAPEAEEGSLLQLNVASLRLDAVLCAALNLSRGDAKALVASGRVSLNHLEQASPHRELQEGDLLSVRGRGRLKLQSVKGITRKNRINIEVLKY